MTDFLARLDGENSAIERRDARDRAQVVEDVENKLLEESHEIVSGVMAFADIEGNEDTPPAEWIAELGPEAAIKKHRLARLGMMPAKDAPVGITVAQNIVKSVLAAKAKRQTNGGDELYLEVVTITLTNQPPDKVIDVTGIQTRRR